jgi:hypothetical protein
MYHTNKKLLEKAKHYAAIRAEEKARNQNVKQIITTMVAYLGFSIIGAMLLGILAVILL